MLANNYGHCTSHARQIFRDYEQISDLDFGQGQGFIGLQDSSPNPNTISGASAIADLARLAENVYGDEHDAGINVRRVGGGFFHRIDTADNLLSGFDAATYVDREHGDAVIVFRGTEPDSVTDWLTDVDALLNPSRLPPQYVQAITYARDMYRELRTQGYNVIITGHSLGGALAEVAHQQTGATTVTFNQAAAPNRRWSEWLTGAQERRTRDNLLRIFDQADPVHDIWHPRRSGFEGGQNYTPGELESLRLPFGITVPRTSIPRHEMGAMKEYWEGVHKSNCLRMRGLL